MKKLFLTIVVSMLFVGVYAQNDPSTTVGDTGSITFTYQGNTVTYTTVRAADGLIWLQHNLGSTQIATHATDSAAYGHYFQWGRWDDGHQFPQSAMASTISINPNNPSGIIIENDSFLVGDYSNYWWVGGQSSNTWSGVAPSATNGLDPCSAIGPGWHMPSHAEFANLMTVEGITDSASAFSSNLRFTLSGRRDFEFGLVRYIDTFGAYWTSTAFDSLGIHESISPASITSNWPIYRGYGVNVRCVTTCTGVYQPDTVIGPDSVCVGSINTFSVLSTTYVSSYLWTLPIGWSISGPGNGNSINAVAGSNGGTIMVVASNSCDTSMPVNLGVFVHPLPMPLITSVGNVLSTGSFSSYQWYLNGNIIVGATSQNFTATQAGAYTVAVTDDNGCMGTSAQYLDVVNTTLANALVIYPNPVNDVLNVEGSNLADIVVTNAHGQVVMLQKCKGTKTELNIEILHAGVYFITVNGFNGERVIRKVVKN